MAQIRHNLKEIIQLIYILKSKLFPNANSIDELLNLLGKGKEFLSRNKDKSKLEKFMNEEIYCSDNFVNVLDRYYEFLK